MFAHLPPAQSNQGSFRWRSTAYHLTYAGHIPRDVLLALLTTLSSIPIVGWSIVHETSDAEAQYDHTHLAWLWKRAVNLSGAQLMDIRYNGVLIHPNIVTKRSLQWVQRIFTLYHHGHKEGSDKVVPPVAGPWQELPQSFDWTEFISTEVSNAPDLLAGVHIAGVAVRSVSDVLLLQTHKRPAPFEHNYTHDQFRPISLPPSFGSSMGTLQIYGDVNLGKTEWACAQFDNPCYTTSRQGLKDFKPHFHDGIVIDKMVFDDWTVTDCEALTDYTQPAQIKVLYGIVKIPKHTKKIIVTNHQNVWPRDPFGQLVGRRVAQMHISTHLKG